MSAKREDGAEGARACSRSQRSTSRFPWGLSGRAGVRRRAWKGSSRSVRLARACGLGGGTCWAGGRGRVNQRNCGGQRRRLGRRQRGLRPQAQRSRVWLLLLLPYPSAFQLRWIPCSPSPSRSERSSSKEARRPSSPFTTRHLPRLPQPTVASSCCSTVTLRTTLSGTLSFQSWSLSLRRTT